MPALPKIEFVDVCFPACGDEDLREARYLASIRPDMLTPYDIELLSKHDETLIPEAVL